MKKVLFTDLDGTLLKNDKTVSDKNRRAIAKLLEAGHYFAVATGRPTYSGFAVVKNLGLTMPGCYMIAYNGAVIYDCARECVRMERTLPMEYVKYLFDEAEKYGIYIQTYEDEYMLTKSSNQNEEMLHYINATGVSCRFCQDVCSELKKEPNKVLLMSLRDIEKLVRFQQDHMEWERGRCNSFFSCKEYLEYCPSGTDKGSGIRSLCELLGLDMENTYAVGDEQNDIPMIKAAGVGISMKNGTEEVKMAADCITENDNEHDAIAEIIEKFII